MQALNSWIKKTALTLAISLGLMVPMFTATASASLFSGAKGEACVAVEADNGSGHCDQSKLKEGENSLTKTLTTLLNLLTMIVGILTVVMLMISGIRFVTANGDSNSITSAKNTLIYALVGLIIVGFAQAIVKLILERIG